MDENKTPQIQMDFDGAFKRFIGSLPDETIVRFINSAFGEDIPIDTPVDKMATETNDKDGRRTSDNYLRIGSHFYHIEAQSGEDNEIAFRMWEYGYRGASAHGRTDTENKVTLDFPAPLVIYLRDTDKTPKELKIELKLPEHKTVSYKVPTKRISDFTPQTLLEGFLLPMVPFYSTVYESKAFLADADAPKTIASDLAAICGGLDKLVEDGALSPATADDMLETFQKYLTNAIRDTEIENAKEVKAAMQAVADYITITDRVKLGEMYKAEGKAEYIANMLRNGVSEDIIRCTGATIGEIKKVKESLLS
jgi:hypothetical protein